MAAYRILVHHVLGPTQVLPPKTPAAPKPAQQATRLAPQAASKAAVKAPTKADGRTPGLQLLSRLNKPGSKDQQA